MGNLNGNLYIAHLGIVHLLRGSGRGQAAWMSSVTICIAARFFWDLRNRGWFWVTLTIIVLLHLPLILLIPWPDIHLTYIAALPFGFADFGIAFGIIQLAENVVERNSKEKSNDSARISAK